MNILILNWRDTQNPMAGGAEYVTFNHAKAWVKAGNTVIWFTAAYPGSVSSEQNYGITIIRKGNAITVFFYAWLYYLKNNRKIDIIVDEVHGIPFFSILYTSKPIIVFIHEIAGTIWDAMYPSAVAWIGKRIEHFYIWLYRNVYYWTDAEFTKKELVTLGVNEAKCEVIPCPIDESIKPGLHKKNEHPTFIFVGRIVPMKGIEAIIDAFGLIKRTLPLAELWVIGSGSSRYVNQLKKKAGSSVLWWGKVPDKQKLSLMGKAHILLHASIKEGWGLVVLEAASQGTPAVAYPSGALVETVKHNTTGLLTSKPSTKELAQLALRLYEDKVNYKRLQASGLTWSTTFSWKIVTNSSLGFLKRVYKES